MVEQLQYLFDDKIFPSTRLQQLMTISAANRYVRRLIDNIDIIEWIAHDFGHALSIRLTKNGVVSYVTETNAKP